MAEQEQEQEQKQEQNSLMDSLDAIKPKSVLEEGSILTGDFNDGMDLNDFDNDSSPEALQPQMTNDASESSVLDEIESSSFKNLSAILSEQFGDNGGNNVPPVQTMNDFSDETYSIAERSRDELSTLRAKSKQNWENVIEGEFWETAGFLEDGSSVADLDIDKITLKNSEKMKNIWDLQERASDVIFQLDNREYEQPYETFATPLNEPVYIYNPDSGAEIEIGTDWSLVKEGANSFRLEKISDQLRECNLDSPELGKKIGDYTLYNYIKASSSQEEVKKEREAQQDASKGSVFGEAFDSFKPDISKATVEPDFDFENLDAELNIDSEPKIDDELDDFKDRLNELNSDIETGNGIDQFNPLQQNQNPQATINRDAGTALVDGVSNLSHGASTTIGSVIKSFLDGRSKKKMANMRMAASNDGMQKNLNDEISRSAFLSGEMTSLSKELKETAGKNPYNSHDDSVRNKSERLARVTGEFERSMGWVQTHIDNAEASLDRDTYQTMKTKIDDVKDNLKEFGKQDINFRNEDGDLVNSKEEQKRLKEKLDQMMKEMQQMIKNVVNSVKSAFTPG
ncbi:MAG: hypothetical protein U9N57_14200 [Pseudomonadota bacterium]|nr:hypothetical protein [Pseudomonadota bacterium]